MCLASQLKYEKANNIFIDILSGLPSLPASQEET